MIIDLPIAPADSASFAHGTFVSENLLLKRLDPADREALLRVMRPAELAQGRVLAEAGDEVTQVYFPRSGAVSLVLMLSDGGQVETMMVGREGVTCATSHLAPRRALARAIVQLPGEAWRIEAARLRELAAGLPRLREALDRYAAQTLEVLELNTACNAAHRLEKRLAKWLLRSHDRSDDDMLPLTQEFLSQMVGAQRTTVTEVAKGLSASGAIDYSRGKITVRNRGLLERLACECYAAGAQRDGSA